MNKVLTQFEEQKSKFHLQNDANENDIRELKKKLIIKSDQYELLEKEFAKLQDKCRDVQNNEFNLSTQKEHQEATVKIQEDQIIKLTTRYQEDEAQWKEDKQELTAKLQELYIALDKTKREANSQIQGLKTKSNEYKQKVKHANNQINTLAQRLALTEMGKEGAAAGGGGSP